MTEITGARPLVNISALDLRLMEMLESDPRKTHTRLAVDLGISRPTVLSMLQRLLDAGIIRTICVADPAAVGYTTSVVFGIQTTPGKLLDVAQRLASLAPIRYVMLCTGRFDIMAWGFFRRSQELLEFLVGGLGKIPELPRVETMVCQEIKVSATLLADGHHYRPKESPVSLDPLDFALIEALQQDSRLSAASLAAKLGTSKSTVSRTMKHLLDEGVIRFMTVVNPYALGYEGMAFIGMKVSPNRINDVAEALARHKHVYTVALSAGRYDVLAWTIFRERRDLMNLLTMELSNIAGVDSMESAINLKIIKASYRFVDMQQKS